MDCEAKNEEGIYFYGVYWILLLLLMACNSKPSQQETSLQEFRDVDKSLEENARDVQERESQYDPEPASAFLKASVLINRMKLLVRMADSTGMRKDIGDSLLINTSYGADLYAAMQEVYRHSADEKHRFELRFTQKEWLDRYFHQVPSVAISTILSKMNHEVETLAAAARVR